MVFLLTVVVAICFVASLLPFLFPGAVIGGLGVLLNAWLADFPAGTLRIGQGVLVVGGPGSAELALQGVLAVYVPILLVLLFILRGR